MSFTSLHSAFVVSVIGPAFPLCPWGGHCLHTLANWCNQATFERQSNVPNTDTQTHAHPSWKEVTLGYFDFIWLLSSPLMRFSASQPHTQHFSYDFTYRLGKITPLYTMSAKSGVPSSWFGHRWLKDMSYKERVCVVEEETKYIYMRSYLISKCLCELKSKLFYVQNTLTRSFR